MIIAAGVAKVSGDATKGNSFAPCDSLVNIALAEGCLYTFQNPDETLCP